MGFLNLTIIFIGFPLIALAFWRQKYLFHHKWDYIFCPIYAVISYLLIFLFGFYSQTSLVFNLVSLVSYFIFAAFKKSLRFGFAILVVGISLNNLVVALNDGKMPTSLINERVKLPFLADVIPLPISFSFFSKNIDLESDISIGDILILSGLIIGSLQIIIQPRKISSPS